MSGTPVSLSITSRGTPARSAHIRMSGRHCTASPHQLSVMTTQCCPSVPGIEDGRHVHGHPYVLATRLARAALSRVYSAYFSSALVRCVLLFHPVQHGLTIGSRCSSAPGRPSAHQAAHTGR